MKHFFGSVLLGLAVFALAACSSPRATDWGMTFTLPAGTTITSSWSGTFTVAAGKWTVKPFSYNKTIAAAAGNASVKLTWAPSDQATSYNLYCSKTSGVTKANGTNIAGIAGSYTHAGLTNGTTYYYVVTAVNSVGESAASAQVSAKPVAGGVNPYTLYGYTTMGTGTAKSETSWDNYQYNTNYQILNNTWGVGINGEGKCSIFTETVNGPAAFGWAYNVTGGWNVVVYPSVGHGWSPNSYYVPAVEFGNEIIVGSGMTEFTKWSVNIK
jgi:hypothetical protein